MIIISVAVDLSDLDREVSGAIGSAWAASTLRTRNSQWKRYITFCDDNDLVPLPAEPRTVARFLVFQARTTRYVTVNNYLSAINRLHAFYGHQINFREYFIIKLVMAGIKRQLGDFSRQKIPLTPEQMQGIYATLDVSDDTVKAMWCALMLSFRSLLRKSNIVPEGKAFTDHLLRRGDVEFTDTGMLLKVHSSKTIRYKERVLEIPISTVSNPAFCVVSMIKDHFMKFPRELDQPGEWALIYEKLFFPKTITFSFILHFLFAEYKHKLSTLKNVRCLNFTLYRRLHSLRQHILN